MFEKFKNQKPELPTGEGQKLNKAFQENLFLFSKVKNKVAFVNDEVMTPLKLEEGKPSPLGLFAEASLSERFQDEPPTGKQRLEVWSGSAEAWSGQEHSRSALLGRAIFKDKEGRLYRDIDLKGIGHIYEAMIRKPGEALWGGTGRYGLLDSDSAFYDYQLSEEFQRAGIRTHRVLAIINLEELIVDGKKISLEEARKGNIIDEKFQPVVEVRAFATKARLWDVSVRGMIAKEDTKKLVSQELGRGKKPLSDEEYLEWFAKTLGRNVGLMHKNGWYHNYLTGHNITLDCRIVDLDSVVDARDKRDWEEDKVNVKDTLSSLAWHMADSRAKVEKTINQFQKSYDAVFLPKEREKYFARKKKEQVQEEG